MTEKKASHLLKHSPTMFDDVVKRVAKQRPVASVFDQRPAFDWGEIDN